MNREELIADAKFAHSIGDTALEDAIYSKLQALDSVNQQQSDINPANGIGWGEAGIIGAGRTFDKIGKGFQQAYFTATNDKPALDALQKSEYENDAAYKKLTDQHPISTSIGEGLPTLAATGGAGLARTMLTSAIPAALSYGSLDDRLKNGAIDAAGAGVGYGIGSTIGRMIKPFENANSPAREGMVSLFKEKNIPMSAANETGNNSLKWIDSALDNLPFSADKQLAAKQAQHAAYNKAISNTFGADSSVLNAETLANARKFLGDQFDSLSSKNRLNFTNNTLNDVAQLQFDAQKFATSDHQRILTNYIDDMLNKVEPNGTISGRAYREFDSAIGKRMRGTTDGDLRSYLGDLRDIFRNAMDDSISVEDQAAWKDVRSKYANLMQVADVAKRSPTGEKISAASLFNNVQRDKYAAFNQGGDLKQLSAAGKEILSPLPDSGTAQRAFYMGLLGGGGGILSGLGAGILSPVGALGVAAGASTPLAVQKAMWGNGKSYLTKGLIDLSPYDMKILQRSGSGLIGLPAAKSSERQ